MLPSRLVALTLEQVPRERQGGTLPGADPGKALALLDRSSGAGGVVRLARMLLYSPIYWGDDHMLMTPYLYRPPCTGRADASPRRRTCEGSTRSGYADRYTAHYEDVRAP
jgi:hypothetical protein